MVQITAIEKYHLLPHLRAGGSGLLEETLFAAAGPCLIHARPCEPQSKVNFVKILSTFGNEKVTFKKSTFEAGEGRVREHNDQQTPRLAT